MTRVNLSGVLMVILIFASIWNAAAGLSQSFHWPPFIEDDWSRLDHDLFRTRIALAALPDAHVEYQTEDLSDTYDVTAYYRLQYILAPIILQRAPVKDGYVLVEFWSTRQVSTVPGLILVEDLGAGFGLFRRP